MAAPGSGKEDKMINPQDMRLQKMMELLEELQFSEKDQEIAERFLEGTCAEDALNELTFMDLTTKQGMEAKSQKVLRDLFTKGRQEDAKRLTLVLFGAGKSSSYRLIPYEWISDVKEKNKLGFPTEMLVSWYSEKIGNNQYWMNKSMYRNLRTFAEHDPQVIKKAMDLHGGGFDNGLLVLYASYFWVKYPDGKEAETVVLDKEDESLMSRYENEILSSLENMFNKQMKASDLQLLIDGVKQEQVTPEMKKIASENAANNFLILLLGGAAFMNFRLSGKLKCCVELILAANESAMLEAMDKMDVREDLKEKGGEYDVLFGIPTNRYISWAALKKHTVVLEALFLKDKQLYVEAFEKADFETGALMLEVIEKKDPLLGRQIKANGKSLQQQQLINGMIKKQTPEFNQLASYLKGEAAVESIYPIEGMLTGSYKYSGSQERRILELYAKSYGYDNFYDRCMAAFLFLEASYAYHSMLLEKGVLSEAQLKHLFAALKRAGLNFEHQLKAASLIYETLYADRYKNAALAVYDEIFGGYLREKHSEMLDAFHKADAFGRYLGLYVMKSSAANYQEEILSFSMDSAKLVKEELMEILKMHPEWEAAAVVMLSSKKAQERELAVRALISWDENAHRKLLQEAYEKEKNAKVRALLQSVFGAENAEMKSVLSCDDLVKERHKGGKKKSLAWAYETSFSPVHKINGEEASEEYLQALLLCYASMGTPGVNEDARLLAQNLKEDELVQYVNELFEKWMDAGAEAKKRWVLYAAAIHGGTPIVAKLKKQIQEWPEHARGAIAADAVCALALNPQPQALLIVDSISRKFKFKQVKAAAGKALDFAAAQLNLTREELADRIVPDLGFNENMERTFDYGERKFKVTITPALEIEIFDENEKKLKNMPAPGKKDDPRTAVASYEAFKELKKQMKATVSSQKARLEMALSCARQWKV